MDVDSINDLLNFSDSDTDSFLYYSSSSSSDSDVDEGTGVSHFETTVRNYTDVQFKQHFRLNRNTVDSLIDMYEQSEEVTRRQISGRPALSAEKEILILLWYVGNTNTFRELANLFNVSKSTAHSVVVRVTGWLVKISHEHIGWPSVEEIPRLATRWELHKRIPGAIGAIDCTHIRIAAPRIDKQCYFNRKRDYSIHMQAVVGINKQFMDVFVGEPGSLHDARVLRRSALYREATNSVSRLFPGETFLLGDSAYPLMDWLIPPYRDNQITSSEQRQFNAIHSSARIYVEHGFGLLKTRFRRLLHFTENVHLSFVVNLTVAACVLHNICLNVNDSLEEVEETSTSIDNESESNDSPGTTNRREILLSELINKNIIHETISNN